MVSLDLRDVYLQVPIHPDSCKYLRFVASGRVYQFKACFGLSTAPQVFTRVMAPVSAMLHRVGIRIRRYLDDWLIQAASRVQVLQALDTVLQLCHQLGEISPGACTKGDLSRRPSGVGEFQGSACPEAHREAFLKRRRISILCGAASVFMARAFRNSGLSDSSSSWRLPQNAFASTTPSSLGIAVTTRFSSAGIPTVAEI